jgi:hypothetical protein
VERREGELGLLLGWQSWTERSRRRSIALVPSSALSCLPSLDNYPASSWMVLELSHIELSDLDLTTHYFIHRFLKYQQLLLLLLLLLSNVNEETEKWIWFRLENKAREAR